ncbi:uncharacterized protein LAESUDRAFT_685559 [Laetiporus sulphureus 93-53]|uniref:F-box domain-containing protein n=1 Tax=Laetiporus sulphureus 93-53 TaxID=1314785 RepID=A0A165C776_9APHY|nr:uncharacterized protein LAESUDRAFT_685559 [Laetiporus sulphureus 93-53]KZT02320.1 hypothetical protein LAESUDRAFT_685559 [Laetiporus sulphureus 93-53]
MPAVLPLELYDEAIDHLWDDPKALAACSLTCRAWVPTSRLHLFRTVRVQNAKHCAGFAAVLAAAPVIARYVHRLTISAEYDGFDQSGQAVEDDEWVNDVVKWVDKLECVRTVGLSRLRWGALMPETQDTLMRLFKNVRMLFLFEVRFDASRDVLDFLSAFPVLDELYFHGVSWAHESPAPLMLSGRESLSKPQIMAKDQERMQLSYLFLDPRSSPMLVTEWLLSHPSEQRLRTIQLCWREIDNMKAVGDLLHASGASLECLLVEFPDGVPEQAVLENEISLVHNTGLRSVHFGGLNVQASRVFLSNHLFPWVTAMLSQIRSTQLQEITFEFEITTVRDLLSLDWERIDRDLSRQEFKGLLVLFYVSCEDSVATVTKEVQELISGRLGGFRERGTLCVSCV